MIRSLSLALVLVLVTAGCDSTDPASDPVPIDVRTAVDVEADPTLGRDPTTGAPLSNGLFTLYDLDAGEVVLSSSETDPAVRARDSVSAVWDVGLRGTTLIFNGGMSGPGAGTAQLLEVPFADVPAAPADGYAADGANTCPAVETPGGTFPGAPYAVCTGSGHGWYHYDAQTNLVTPIAGRTIALTTGEGDYAKMRILSYYRGRPDAPDADDTGRYYTFEYVVQPDGSRSFTTAD